MKNKARLLVVFMLAAVVAGSGSFHAQAAAHSPLTGVWRATEMGAAPNAHKAVGLAIFADTHYSIMAFDAESERPDVADVSKASSRGRSTGTPEASTSRMGPRTGLFARSSCP